VTDGTKRIIDEEGDHLTYTTYDSDGNRGVNIERMDLDVTPKEIAGTISSFAENLLNHAPAGADIVDVLNAVSILKKEVELVPDLKKSGKK
jgi:hypothetical protein